MNVESLHSPLNSEIYTKPNIETSELSLKISLCTDFKNLENCRKFIRFSPYERNEPWSYSREQDYRLTPKITELFYLHLRAFNRAEKLLELNLKDECFPFIPFLSDWCLEGAFSACINAEKALQTAAQFLQKKESLLELNKGKALTAAYDAFFKTKKINWLINTEKEYIESSTLEKVQNIQRKAQKVIKELIRIEAKKLGEKSKSNTIDLSLSKLKSETLIEIHCEELETFLLEEPENTDETKIAPLLKEACEIQSLATSLLESVSKEHQVVLSVEISDLSLIKDSLIYYIGNQDYSNRLTILEDLYKSFFTKASCILRDYSKEVLKEGSDWKEILKKGRIVYQMGKEVREKLHKEFSLQIKPYTALLRIDQMKLLLYTQEKCNTLSKKTILDFRSELFIKQLDLNSFFESFEDEKLNRGQKDQLLNENKNLCKEIKSLKRYTYWRLPKLPS